LSLNHVLYGIAAAPANANDFNLCSQIEVVVDHFDVHGGHGELL
jgi:hypothetical protein